MEQRWKEEERPKLEWGKWSNDGKEENGQNWCEVKWNSSDKEERDRKRDEKAQGSPDKEERGRKRDETTLVSSDIGHQKSGGNDRYRCVRGCFIGTSYAPPTK